MLSTETVAEEVGADVEEEEGYACGVGYPCAPECGVEAPVLGEDPAEEYAKAYAYVPRYEEGGIGGAALVVGGKVDEHVLERGEHVSVAKTYYQGSSIEGPDVVDGGKKQVAEE